MQELTLNITFSRINRMMSTSFPTEEDVEVPRRSVSPGLRFFTKYTLQDRLKFKSLIDDKDI